MVILDLILLFLLSIIPACFSYFLDYCLGQPGSDQPSTGAILFGWTLYLAKKRLSPGKMQDLLNSFQEMLRSPDPETRRDGQQQLDLTIVMEAKKLFTYEQVLGMCIYCTNFWLCLIAAMLFSLSIHLSTLTPIWFFIVIPILSHSIIRKL